VIRLITGVNPRTPCRQLFKELNMPTIVSLYILEVVSYLRIHNRFVQLNSNIHTYNTRRKEEGYSHHPIVQDWHITEV
jgi:hypothetical protein